jgi:hypothetical protein
LDWGGKKVKAARLSKGNPGKKIESRKFGRD